MEIPEIIKALKFCISQTDHTCYEEMEECPYSNCLIDCQDRLMKEAADALEMLSATPENKPLTVKREDCSTCQFIDVDRDKEPCRHCKHNYLSKYTHKPEGSEKT